MYEKMADHSKSCLRQKLPQMRVVSVTNRYAATTETSISIVDILRRVANRSRSPVSPVCMAGGWLVGWWLAGWLAGGWLVAGWLVG